MQEKFLGSIPFLSSSRSGHFSVLYLTLFVDAEIGKDCLTIVGVGAWDEFAFP
jgi:hypothetical protein